MPRNVRRKGRLSKKPWTSRRLRTSRFTIAVFSGHVLTPHTANAEAARLLSAVQESVDVVSIFHAAQVVAGADGAQDMDVDTARSKDCDVRDSLQLHVSQNIRKREGESESKNDVLCGPKKLGCRCGSDARRDCRSQR